ncbi:MAG: hypothetical protein IJ022_00585 [Burkholderiaceae bacterium]|nr:hypothetical protein [Burkholderiaceae bacterium]
MANRLFLILTTLILVMLTGCAMQSSYQQPFQPHSTRSELDPLIDAPLRMQTTCRGTGLYTPSTALGGFSFECSDLDVVATLNELRDAGWRVEKISIGDTVIGEEESGVPLTCTLRKVY